MPLLKHYSVLQKIKNIWEQFRIISVLHTWGQQLSFHPHIHSIVGGGGITDDGNWKDAKKNIYCFLFPLKAMSVVYKTKFLQALKELIASKTVILTADTNTSALFNTLYKKEWIIYTKAPFGGPQSVIEYLEDILIKWLLAITGSAALMMRMGRLLLRIKIMLITINKSK